MSQETEQDRADHISGTEPLKDTDKTKFIPGAMGERIAFLRKRKKLTQAQLAAQLGISAQAVSKWESGVSQS